MTTPTASERLAGRTAVVANGRSVTYDELDAIAERVASGLVGDRGDLGESRVAFRVPPGLGWVTTLFGIWRAGGVAVPLAWSHPPAELAYVVEDSGASVVVVDDAGADPIAMSLASIAATARARFVTVDELARTTVGDLPQVNPDRRALIIYTSGTTGRPKGVVSTHDNLMAQIASLVDAWEWTEDDRTWLVLPLHHVHGILNVVLSALSAGGVCEIPPRFDAVETWTRLASGEITVFSAVPTIYHRLIAAWDEAAPAVRERWSSGAAQARLMMCGSAALPARVLTRWRDITSHTLLERYGMTEIGMALSNPLRGERRPGFVGAPLPGVSVALVDEQGIAVPAGTVGEIEVRGPGVFREYWARPDETRAAFRDDWFRTGDLAVVEDGAVRLLGRMSVDVLKTGGFKVSALEIEDTLREHPAVGDCAVVGLPDEEWGERVAVAVELRAGETLSLASLQAWAVSRLAPYKIPRALVCGALPRNAMGKVVKPSVTARFAGGVA